MNVLDRAQGAIRMPLQDHFHPPLSARRHWHAFHNAWATYLSSDLNRRLPPGYFAESNVQFNIEIDVAAFEESGAAPAAGTEELWKPAAPARTIPFTIATDVVEVLVFSQEGGPTLAGAVELVSPANKDRPAHRNAFVSKCEAYLQQGVGLVIVDVVTERETNLHNELLARLSGAAAPFLDALLYATAYRPVGQNGQGNLDIWEETLAVGRALPTLPLWLRGGLRLPVELETTYERTCKEQRVTANGAPVAIGKPPKEDPSP
jgi:hypothetical protein